MKIGFYKVDNSLGFDRHSFDDMSAEQIELHLQPLLNDNNEAAIVNLDDKESVEFFTEEYNDEIYDLGWWCVLIRDEKNGYSDTMQDKLSWLLQSHYNTFHADMIQRGMNDDSISAEDFIKGCVAIHTSERDTNDDEFTPAEFQNV